MKSVALSLLLSTLGAAEADGSGKDHPIVRVIGLVKDLKNKAIAEGKEEAVAYSKFEYWLTTSVSTLKDAIADEKERIEELTTKLEGLKKQESSLEKEIDTLKDQMASIKAADKKAKDNRKEAADLYSQANKDLSSTIKAVEECIKALTGAESKTESMLLAQKRMKTLLSLVSLKVTEQQRMVLSSVERPDQLAKGDLAAHTDKYDFKSENVIELLKELKQKFEDDKLAGTKAETAAINAHELAMSASSNAFDAAEDSAKGKTTELGETRDNIADANKDLKSTQSDFKSDSASLDETQKAGRVKKSEWDERSQTRTLEIEAMDQAIKILSKSTGVRTEAPGNPVPPPSPVALLEVVDANEPKMKAVALLKEAAKDAHSKALERLAVEVAAHLNGPFDQVNNMIEKMIFRLMDEQKQEDEHKHWCDQEISKTESMQDHKNEKIDNLKAEIKVENGKIALRTSEIKDANDMIAEIQTFMKEATEIRNTGKKENVLALKDSEDAQKSLADAIAVLTAFYKESGEVKKEPWEFIQEPVKLPKNPATWDSGYTGVADPDKQPGGIISVLEAVNSDFAKMAAETKSQEAQDQAEYEESIKANKIEQAEREEEVRQKSAEKARRVDKVASLSSTLKDTQGELEKTDQYMKDLQPACVDGDSKYEDRVKARSKEIDALKKAQVILLDAFKEKSKSFLQIKRH